MELNTNRFYTVDEAAQVLRVHPNTVLTYIRDHKLDCSRPGTHTIIISGADIQRFYDDHKPKEEE